jgi:hypothetical protein
VPNLNVGIFLKERDAIVEEARGISLLEMIREIILIKLLININC